MSGGPVALDTDAARRGGQIRRELDRFASPDGFVRFDRFMDVALYSEGAGYYARGGSPFGPRGDFYTAAHVSPLFGRTIAARLRAVRAALAPQRPFAIVEVGPGDGTLAGSVLAALGEAGDADGISYHLVDRSRDLAETARRHAEPVARAAGIPLTVDPALGGDGPIVGAVLANELLDAQPVRRFRWTGTEWRELGVRANGDRFEPAEAPVTSPVPPPSLPAPAEPDVVIECSPEAEAWVRGVADALAEGVAEVVDYGMDESELLAAHPRGTLATLRHHRDAGPPWEDPGTRDLSTFVNFTRVRAAAARAGLAEVAFRSQAETLGTWGFPAELERSIRAAASPEEEVRTRLAAKNLLFGFERFRVLELAAPASAGTLRRITPPVA